MSSTPGANPTTPTAAPTTTPPRELTLFERASRHLNPPPPFTPDLVKSVGLSGNNERTSEYNVKRAYTTDASGHTSVRTVPPDYVPKPGEYTRVHKGIDLSSRDAAGKPAPQEFKAAISGQVVPPIETKVGTIAVRKDDGTTVQYLHTSKSHVQIGDKVTPDTPLGVTGKEGASQIHLHIQAFDKKYQPINPEEAFTPAPLPPPAPAPR